MAGFLRRLRYVPLFGGLLLTASSVLARATAALQDAAAVPYVDMHVDLPYQHNFNHAELLSGTGQFSAVFATPACLSTVVLPQILYVASRVGTEHVGIGSDFEGDIRPPVGLSNLGDVQQLASALEAGGTAAKDVKAITGEKRYAAPYPMAPARLVTGGKLACRRNHATGHCAQDRVPAHQRNGLVRIFPAQAFLSGMATEQVGESCVGF